MQTTTANEAKKVVNPHRISWKQYCEDNGVTDTLGFIEDVICGSINTPALCKEGCETDPDGRCEHGCPSVLIALGMI